MTPTPTALGMRLCDHLIVEEGTKRLSLINCFTALRYAEFPTERRTFFVAADLTDGSGAGTAELVVVRADDREVVFRQSRPIRFPSRLALVQYGWKVTECVFPAPGRYEVALYVDGGWSAHRMLDVYDTGGTL